MKKPLIALACIMLFGCVGKPEKVTPVKNFQLDRYLGKWYEIARLDHSFERGMNQVTATYSMKEDGGVQVLNRGYSTQDKEWKSAEGKAYFVDSSDEGYLKVSFFGPFYGSYIVFELEKENYDYAFISGPNHSYLWLLSRTPEVSAEIQQKFKSQAEELGFDISQLIWVKQTAD
ncbi:lipocalin family protein [Vibrio neonatus]|uniref:lipocalin family protein n=1 Tax=Vibrio neonatus TaxID=278860 RepID=UPI0021C2AFF2|nr:lipocalin family protein [Vibrio neonatus]